MARAGYWSSLILLWAILPVGAELTPRDVVIVCNENEPESRPLAEYYAQQRGVPTNQICAIRARAAETITRREFRDEVQEPILRFLTRQGLLTQRPATVGGLPTLETVGSRVSALVLMYGVPLRIEADASLAEKATDRMRPEMKRNEASVESELALLPTLGLPAAGVLRNPFFQSLNPQFEPPLNRQMLLVGRLDGPEPATVRRMIDDALAVERDGLHGRAYFDMQGNQQGGYVEGDNWIKASYRLFREAGFECELDEKPAVFAPEYPMTDVAVYAGWYTEHVTGPFKREGFRFRMGAVAYHIHSWSAASLRVKQTLWAGPFLDKGAAVTMGNVFEPYLAMTPHVDLFSQRLLDGATFLEAAYYSQPVLSWQTTFVGDPLYSPFVVALDDQIARLEAAKNPDVEWAYLRKINLLLLRGREFDAEKLCREKSVASAVLQEKLGDILLADQRAREAAVAFQQAMDAAGDAYRVLRIAPKLARAYEANRQPGLALAVYEGLIRAWGARLEFCQRARDLADKAGDADKVRAFQNQIDQLSRSP